MARILIVEDDIESCELMSNIAKLDDHTAIAYYSAEKARERIFDLQPEVAIIDINLPDEHGVSFSWWLRRHFEDLPIIITSAVLPQWDLEDITDCGADYILAKPYRIDELRDTLNHFVGEGRRAFSILRTMNHVS